MNRLQIELHRLYAAHAPGGLDPAGDDHGLVDGHGRVRAMVLELARPADWAALAKVWNGVQLDLELPAPAIAVSGQHGVQLWFSLAEPLPAAQALGFLQALQQRYLGDVKAQRLTLLPAFDAAAPQPLRHAAPVPALQAGSGLWSAFVAPDLAPVFAEEPWLDHPANPDGQAKLLAPLKSMAAVDFQLALQRLQPPPPLPAPPAASQRTAAAPELARSTPRPSAGPLTPRQFLLDVMHNEALAMDLRIDAAKALLPYVDEPGGQ